MSQGASPINRRVVLKLDASLAFEALILNRLSRLPKPRHQEWLRGLLVQGFVSECHNLRTLQRSFEEIDDVQSGAMEGVVPPREASSSSTLITQRTTTRPAEKRVRESAPIDGTVSFAALRNVIG